LRILWLKTELLHPVDKGGKIRTYHMLRALRREHHVTYLTLDDGSGAADAEARAAEYCHELVRVPFGVRAKFSAGFYAELAANLVSSLPYFMKKYESAGMRREIEARGRAGEFDVLVCDFLQPSVNVPARLPFATVLFQHNVEAMIWKRHYEVQRNPVKKAYLYGQWRKSFAYERAACRRFDAVVAVSREDAETMRRDYGVERVADVPTGVDTDYFRPGAYLGDGNNNNGAHRSGGDNEQGAARAPHNLVFTGSMDWLPNEDAIQYFTREIMPLVKERVPDVTLTVVGRNPYASLVDLSKRDPSIIVTGRVDDVRPYMDGAAAYVVPIRVGGGTRLKIYEAMAMEQPIVSTTIGAEGLPVRDGSHLLLADTPQAFAAAVVRVLTDKPFAAALGQSAARLVREEFGWQRVAASFTEISREAVRRKQTGSSTTS
jgi:glycosyltransferase involved in cell wall biosynthesis